MARTVLDATKCSPTTRTGHESEPHRPVRLARPLPHLEAPEELSFSIGIHFSNTGKYTISLTFETQIFVCNNDVLIRQKEQDHMILFTRRPAANLYIQRYWKLPYTETARYCHVREARTVPTPAYGTRPASSPPNNHGPFSTGYPPTPGKRIRQNLMSGPISRIP